MVETSKQSDADSVQQVNLSESPPRRGWLYRSLQWLVSLPYAVMFRYRVRGLENVPLEKPAILLVNHLSFLDPAMVCYCFKRPVSFMARDSLFRVPILGWAIRKLHAFPVKRRAASSETVRNAVGRLKTGYLVGLFPEGTRSDDGTLGTIKPGFVALVRRYPVPVIPIAIAGTDRALPRGAWWVRWATIRVVIGEPISAEEVEGLCQKGREKEFADLVRDRLAESYEEAKRWRDGKASPAKNIEVDEKQLP